MLNRSVRWGLVVVAMLLAPMCAAAPSGPPTTTTAPPVSGAAGTVGTLDSDSVLTMPAASPGEGTRYFVEPFECDYLHENVEDPDGAFVVGGETVALATSTGVDDKHYMRTTYADYNGEDFTAQLTFDTSAILDPHALLHFGVGKGEPGGSAYANEPASSVFVRVHCFRLVIPPPLAQTIQAFIVEIESRDSTGASVYSATSPVIAAAAPGRYWLSMRKQGHALRFDLDSAWGGSWHETFAPAHTVDVDVTTVAPYLTSANSHVFFGTSSTKLRVGDLIVKRQWWYVSPDGVSGNNGRTRSRPWDLKSTMRGDQGVGPGDTVWLLPGSPSNRTYKSTGYARWDGGYLVGLVGAAGSPIHVRAFRDAGMRPLRARIDGSLSLATGLTSASQYVWFWDLEIMTTTPRPPPGVADVRTMNRPPGGFHFLEAHGCRCINTHIHDSYQGFQSLANDPVTDTMVYGCIIHDIGHTSVQAIEDDPPTINGVDVVGGPYGAGSGVGIAHATLPTTPTFNAGEFIVVRNRATGERFVTSVISVGAGGIQADLPQQIDSGWELRKGELTEGEASPIYSRGDGGQTIADCIVTANEGYSMLIHTDSPPIENYIIDGHISYLNTNPDVERFGRFLIGGSQPVTNVLVKNSIFYKDGGRYGTGTTTGPLPTGWGARAGMQIGMQITQMGLTVPNVDCVVHDNIVAYGALCIFNFPAAGVTQQDNTLVHGNVNVNPAGDTCAGFDSGAAWPSGWNPKVILRQNRYDARRFHLVIMNAPGSPVDIDFAGYLEPGDSIDLFDPRSIYGTPLHTGTLTGTGSVLSIPVDTNAEFTTYVGFRTCQ